MIDCHNFILWLLFWIYTGEYTRGIYKGIYKGIIQVSQGSVKLLIDCHIISLCDCYLEYCLSSFHHTYDCLFAYLIFVNSTNSGASVKKLTERIFSQLTRKGLLAVPFYTVCYFTKNVSFYTQCVSSLTVCKFTQRV